MLEITEKQRSDNTQKTVENTIGTQPEIIDAGIAKPPNVWSPSDPTDGRTNFEFKSRYPITIRFQIISEAIYLLGLILTGFFLVFWIYSGDTVLHFTSLHFNDLNEQIKKLATFPIAGLIGGAMFGLKYLYRVAARGWWHEDRRIWRICSPWLSASLAMMVGIMIDGGLLGLSYSQGSSSNPHSTLLSVGFVTGYFADSALAKLQEIANVVFGSSPRNPSDEKK